MPLSSQKHDAMAELMEEIEAEAKAEGPQAVLHLRQMEYRYRLATQVYLARKKLKLSRKELALRSNVSLGDIRGIEGGTGNPTFTDLISIMVALDKRLF